MSAFHNKKATDKETGLKVRLHSHDNKGNYRILHRASGDVQYVPGTQEPIIADSSMIGPGRRFVLD